MPSPNRPRPSYPAPRTPSTRRNGPHRRRSPALQLERLEDWIAPATGVLASGLFQLDGNALTTDPPGATALHDFDQVYAAGTYGPSHGQSPVFIVDGLAANNGGTTGLPATDPGKVDTTVFTGGSTKDTTDLSQWQWTTTNIQAKNDLQNAYAVAYVNPDDGHLILYFGADRGDNNGDAFIGFWLFENAISLNSDGTFNGVHADGDVLLQANVNASSATIQVSRWSTATNSLVSLGMVSNEIAFVTSNATAVTAPWPYRFGNGAPPPPSGTFPALTFFEGGIDVTAALNTTDCQSFLSFMAETRSSSSFESTLSDFVMGSVNFNNCPDVTVSKAADQPTVSAGQTAGYTVTVSNLGAAAASGPALSDLLPDLGGGNAWTIDTGTGNPAAFTLTGPAGSQTLSLAPGVTTLAAGASLTVHLTGTTQSGVSRTLANTATVSAANEDAAHQGNNQASASITVTGEADLQVTKSAPPTVVPGQNLTYTITVSNVAAGNAEAVSVSDALPAGTTFVSLAQTSGPAFTTSAPAVGANGTVTLSNALLAAGASATFSLVVHVGSGVTGTLSNTAAGTTTTQETTTANNAGTATTNATPQADLQVTKTGPASVVPGQSLTYTITVANVGPSDAQTVAVSDALPAGTMFVSLTQTAGPTFGASTPAVGANGTVTLTRGTLAAGASATFSLVVSVGSGVTSTLSNTASGTTDTPEVTTANNSDTEQTPVTPQADVQVTKTGPATAVPGRDVTYTVTVANVGPSDAQAVSVTDPLPAGTTFVSLAETSGPTFGVSAPAVGANGTVTLTRGSLAAGASATFTLVVRVGSGATGSVSNTATGSTSTTETNSSNNSGTATTTLTPEADLSVTKTDGSGTYTPGTPITYTIVVTNAGPSDVTGATVTDALPAALNGATWAATYNGGSGPTAGTGDINAAVNLPSGAAVTFTVSATVRSDATGNLVNTASAAVPSGVTDPNPDNNSATDTDTESRVADLQVTKTNGVTAVVPGQAVTYTVTVTNAGPSDVTGAAISDAFPAALTNVTWTASGTGGASGFGSGSGSSLAQTLNLPVGATVTYVVSATVHPSATGTLSNTATVSAPVGVNDPNTDNNSATDADPLTPRVDVSVTKTDGTTTAVPGTTTAYTIVVTNAGPSTAAGVVLNDPFPAAITSASWSSGASAGASGNTANGSGAIADTLTLLPGASVTYTVTAAISPSATGSLSNTASATVPGGTTDTDPSNDSATDTDTLDPQADLQVTKTNGVTSVVPGTAVTYTVVVTNIGPSSVAGAVVSDAFPAALTNMSWTAAGSGGAAGFSGGAGASLNQTVDLPVGASVTYTVSGTVAASATGTLSNTATVSAPAGVTDPTPDNNSATDADPLTPQADLVVAKTGPATVVPGQTLTYTIAVTNTGPSDAVSVSVSDQLPPGATFVSLTQTGGPTFTATTPAVGQPGSVTLSGASLAAGAGATFALIVRVNTDVTAGLSNTAAVSAATPDPDPTDNSSTADTAVTPQADLRVTKVGPATAAPGTDLTYTITVSNAGSSDARDVSVSDPLPPGTTYVSLTQTGGPAFGASATASGSGATVGLTASALAAGASATFQLVVRVSAAATGTLTNTATGTTTTPDPDPSNNAGTAETALAPQADLRISKTNGATTAVPGTPVTYTIVVTNAGPSAVTGATVTDLFAATLLGITWSASYSAGSGGPAGGTGDINAAVDLAAGGSATYTATGTVRPDATGSLSNTATVSAPGGVTDPTPDNNSATDTDPLTPVADLGVAKSAGSATFTPGRGVAYTVVVTNAGPSDAVGAVVTDALPAGLVGATWTVSYTGGAGGPAAGSGDINATMNLPAGATATITVSATAQSDATGTLSNTATVTPPVGATDPVPANNSATVVTTSTPAADLRVSKTNGTASARPRDTLTYTLTVANAGPSDATDVVLTDILPELTQFAGASDGGMLAGRMVGWALGTVPAGATITRTVTVVVGATVPAGATAVQNTASVTSTVADDSPADNTASDTDELVAAPDLVVTITDGTDTARPGDTLTYTLTVRNVGPQGATGVALTNLLPAGTTFVGASDGGTSGNGVVTWDLGAVPAGATLTRTLTVRVDAVLSAGVTALTSTATVADDGANGLDPTPANNTAADTDAMPGTSAVAGSVFVDRSNDGVRQPGEPGIPGVTVTLEGTDDLGNQVVRTAVSGRGGSYLFADLRPGTYRLTEGQPTGLLDGQDSVGPQGGTAGNDVLTFAIANGVVASGNGFGELIPSSVTGTVYLDLDRNGVAGPADAGLGGVEVTLVGTDDLGNPVTRTVVTADDGSYYFGELRPGTYRVGRGALPGYSAGDATVGSIGGTVADRATIGGIGLNQDTAAVQYLFGAVPDDAGKRLFLGSTPATGSLAGRVPPLQGRSLPRTIPAMSLAVPFVAAAPLADGPPVVQVLDAQTGEERFRFAPFESSFRGGVRTTVGDLNGDGVPELAVGAGAGGGPRVSVFDGRTGGVLDGPLGNFFAFEPTFTGGVTVAAADLNGDGFADLVVGAGAGGGPRVTAYSGRDGSVLRDFFAFDPSLRSGVNVAAGDTDGDGFADVVAGAAAGGGPQVTVFSGRDGAVLRSFFAFDPELRGGVNVAVGDADGDGLADVVAAPASGGGPNVRVFDGPSGRLVADFFAFDPAVRGGVSVAAANLDGDGRADVVASAGPAVRVFPRVTIDTGAFTDLDGDFALAGVNLAAG